MIKAQSGEILVIVIAAIGVVLFTVLFIIAGAQIYFGNAKYSVDSEKALLLAEAGVDKAVNSLNKLGGSYVGESETILGDGSYSVEVISKDAATKTIKSTGYVPGKTNPRAKRVVQIDFSRGVGVAFNYGIQVGEGGLELANSNVIEGSIYSNGSITAGNGNNFTGDVWVAGGPQGSPDQQQDCQGANCLDFTFGKSVSGEARLDVAMSFQPSAEALLNRISIKVKKTGNPPDVTVRILRDRNGQPDKNGVITSGTLYASLVTSDYGFIDVAFSSTPNLLADSTYWIMIDTSSDSNNYWSWQQDLAQSYSRGSGRWSANWNAGNPTWNAVSGDLSFKTIMGGGATSVRGGINNTVGGEVHANTIENMAIAKDAYYQTIINSTVVGSSHPGSADPPPKIFPISEANVAQWKQQAQNQGVQTGDITTCVSTLDSGKIVGNVTFGSNCNVTVKSPIWITGNLTINSNNDLTLDSSYGTTSGVIVVDGTVELGTNNHLLGTGQGSSVLMVLSTYDSRSNGISAILVKNTGNTGVFYAATGIIEPGNKNTYKELTAWTIKLINNSVINYETGLSSTLFTSGPSGAYSLIKGTYQVK